MPNALHSTQRSYRKMQKLVVQLTKRDLTTPTNHNTKRLNKASRDLARLDRRIARLQPKQSRGERRAILFPKKDENKTE